MTKHPWPFLTLVSVALVTATTPLAAQSPEELAPDSPEALQGEYYGPSNYQIMLGLQVKALGNGEYSARLYEGGLPGNGWYGGQVYELHGRQDGPILGLAGEGWVVALRHPRATVYRDGGSFVAGLTKVERASPTLGLKPPPDAEVLFDPAAPSTAAFKSARISPEGYLERGAETKKNYRDFRLHVEFRTPFMPTARGQARGNSGIYLQRRYEVQILDSFGDEPIFNGAAALYRTQPPRINMCFPPGVWQTYDIEFQAARYDEQGRKIAPAVVTVWHNGILVHDHFVLPNKTGAGRPEGPEPGPILFQDHRDPVQYRYIWVQPKEPWESVPAVPIAASRCAP